MENNPLLLRSRRNNLFIAKARDILKGFGTKYDGVEPYGNLVTDTFVCGLFRKAEFENGIERLLPHFMNCEVPNEVAEAIKDLEYKINNDKDGVQVIKVRFTQASKPEVVHGWIVTLYRDLNTHNLEWGKHLTKGQLFYTRSNLKSKALLELVSETFCYE
ncbi:hypothetical protein OTK49_21105 [Vibrio coralliirubri]|uniref:hypothetical protein n=1 Tax=Vibrio coralliirubri TaxID=1516159 RepID=UPI00228368A9|nr:hypothetical protein [Vibrio coralliirubri]MCY9865019.1 hypothetical protein [Vibrio coralliirubri]